MFKWLFGESESDQLVYLQKKVILTAICIIIDVIWFIASGNFGLTAISCYIWGWTFMKALFGLTAVGSIFSGNVVIAAIFICAYLLIGGIGGAICMFLGIGRYIFLKAKFAKSKV